jgi:O-antigen/teichoic acid export membrane protein
MSAVSPPPRFGSEAVGRLLGDSLSRNALSLMLNVVMTSLLGVVFWMAAARLFPSSVVGRDSALVSAMVVVSTVCALNLSSAILRFLPITKLSPSRVVLGAYGVTVLVSLAGGTAFVIVAPLLSKSYRFLEEDHLVAVTYVLAVAAWGVFALQDSVLTALRQAHWVPVENSAFGILKVAALPVLLTVHAGHAVFVAWMIPMILLLFPVNYVIFRRTMPARVAPTGELSPIERFGRRGLAAFMAGDYAATIFLQAGSTLLPVVVVALLGTARGAYFYMPFTIIGAFDLLFVNVCASATVEASLTPDRAGALVMTTVRKFGPVLVAGVLVIVAGASLLLLPYGHAYSSQGATLLRLLACASLFRAVVSVYAATCRIRGQAGRGMIMQAGLMALVMAAITVLGRRHGLTGVGAGWLLANAALALIVLPSLVGFVRGPAGLRASQLEPVR